MRSSRILRAALQLVLTAQQGGVLVDLPHEWPKSFAFNPGAFRECSRRTAATGRQPSRSRSTLASRALSWRSVTAAPSGCTSRQCAAVTTFPISARTGSPLEQLAYLSGLSDLPAAASPPRRRNRRLQNSSEHRRALRRGRWSVPTESSRPLRAARRGPKTLQRGYHFGRRAVCRRRDPSRIGFCGALHAAAAPCAQQHRWAAAHGRPGRQIDFAEFAVGENSSQFGHALRERVKPRRVVATERVEVLLCRTGADAELEAIAADLHQREHAMREIDRVIQRHLHDCGADLHRLRHCGRDRNAMNGSVIAKPRPIACTDHKLSKPSPSNVRACSARNRDDDPVGERTDGSEQGAEFHRRLIS